MNIEVVKLNKGAILPKYQTELAAGFDFHAALEQEHILKPGERCAVPTGLAIAIPAGYVLGVFARSGLSSKYGITMANGVGIIDADYRGEIAVLLVNNGIENFVIEPNMRIAQGIVFKHETAQWKLVDELDKTKRGSRGFGSTGA